MLLPGSGLLIEIATCGELLLEEKLGVSLGTHFVPCYLLYSFIFLALGGRCPSMAFYILASHQYTQHYVYASGASFRGLWLDRPRI